MKQPRARRGKGSAVSMTRDAIRRILAISIYFASGAAVASLLLEYGFRVSPVDSFILHAADYAIVGIFMANTLCSLLIAPSKFRHFKENVADFVLAAALFVALLLIRKLVPSIHGVNGVAAARFYLVAMQVYMVVYIAFQLSLFGRKMSELGLSPPLTVVLSFLIVVLLGTLLLSLPNATASRERAPFLTALFTATSATTVTGLVVVDTGGYFSLFGQIIILALIQVGGLGMMTLVSFFAVIAGRGMGLKERAVVGDILDQPFMGRVRRLIIIIILTTAAIELTGTGLLYIILRGDPLLRGEAFYFSLFHVIAAFCNAGFSLFQDNLVRYRDSYGFNFVIISMIVLGGLGFQVLQNIFNAVRYRLNNKARRERLSLHSKLVLTTTAFLLALGTFIFFLLLGRVGTDELNAAQRGMAAFFQSVTTRTAGFNTIDIGAVGAPFLFVALVLMFIGASPGSTGGGIKTSTAAVLFTAMVSIFSSREKACAFKRTIPDELIKKALAVLVTSFGLTALITFMLTLFEKYSFMDLLFEVTSAMGTVGLSRGITADLTPEGKILIVIAMFVGRIGPLTLFLALSYREKKAVFEYPEERVIIG